METNSIIITTIIVSVIAALILSLFNSSRELTVTIKMEDDGYPLKDDGVVELEVKPKRKYKKRTPKANVIKTTPTAKKTVGRPRKVN